MTESLRAFMNGIIDYAGLFPPAKLPLDTAIHNYTDYRKSSDSWMLSRFIIPASKLPEVSKYGDKLFSDDKPFAFSVLGKKTETIDEFDEEIEEVLACCTEFCEAHFGSVTTEMMEIKLPEEAVFSQNVDLLKNLMDETAERLSKSRLTPSFIFYEGSFSNHWKKNNKAIIKAVSTHNDETFQVKNYHFAAYKIRCGGVKAELFPSVEQVAFFLNTAQNNNVAIKGTAGLHHPVRHYEDEVQTKMHGFFNVFGGAMLAHINDFNDATLREVLNEENPDNFSFTDEAFRWKDYSVTTQQIKSLREEYLLSYGSCSFDEPREDLAQLKLL